MRNMICSACVMIMMSFTLIEVHGMRPEWFVVARAEIPGAAESRIISELLAKAEKEKTTEVPADEWEIMMARTHAIKATAEAVVNILEAEAAKENAKKKEHAIRVDAEYMDWISSYERQAIQMKAEKAALEKIENFSFGTGQDGVCVTLIGGEKVNLHGISLNTYGSGERGQNREVVARALAQKEALEAKEKAANAACCAKTEAAKAEAIADQARMKALDALSAVTMGRRDMLEEIKAEIKKVREQKAAKSVIGS